MLPAVLSGVGAGMTGLPGVGFVAGAGPCISTVTPCGMLPIRTMVGTSPGAGVPTIAAGTFMISPGSIRSACPLSWSIRLGTFREGAGSASLARWR
jgi:hypothetical protein